MRVYNLETTVILPCSLDEAWDFFGSPANLNRITPPDLRFEILSGPGKGKMYAGLIINYRVRPIWNIPMRWTTEITHCEDKRYFVDEQRFGPYAFWHHQHHFEETNEGVRMKDIVHYAVGMGWIGRLANQFIVKNKLKAIFDYRENAVQEIFGPSKTSH
jgi:ligand-binding SRPBCC domain-containing protein